MANFLTLETLTFESPNTYKAPADLVKFENLKTPDSQL